MSAPRFFHPAALPREAVGLEIDLPDTVVHHAVRVRRLGEGDAIVLFDGEGGEFAATLTVVDRRRASARLVAFDPVEREAALAATIVPALIASDPMDAVIRKAVELGAAAIVPVIAARSQGGRDNGRGERRLAHWREIAVGACEQCGRNRIPPIAEPVPFTKWLSDTGACDAAAMLAPGAALSLAAWGQRRDRATLVIGPEGGWTDDELARAASAGVAHVHLGPRVLRADTAALAALAVLAATAGDFR